MFLKGVKPHKKTGILWLRLRTPAHLIAKRAELEKMGVDFRVEHHRSLETRDPKIAAKNYGKRVGEIEAIWRGWEQRLEGRGEKLSVRNVVALAGGHAREFFQRYEDEPFDAPPPGPDPVVPKADAEAFAKAFKELSPEDREELEENMRRFLKGQGETQRMMVFTKLAQHPEIAADLAPSIADGIEAIAGGETEEVLEAHNLDVDGETRRLLNLYLGHFMGAARRGLEQRQGGDWGPVPGLDALPPFQSSRGKKPVSATQSWRHGDDLTFSAVIEEQVRLSDLKLDKHIKSARTFSKYREDCERFAEWRKSRNLLSVTALEVSQWRDHMLAITGDGEMRRKTIINRVTGVRAVINWAIDHNKRARMQGQKIAAIFPDGNPLVGIDLPERQIVESEERTLSLQEATLLLTATRKEVEPHLRWVQWLLSYSGMRIGEACQLEKRDVMAYGGCWYLMIRVDDVRTTKTRKSRRIPLHDAVIAEGFLEFVQSAPDGRLFPKYAAKYVRDWAHSVVEEHGGFDGKPPLHGSRHLFGDIATGHVEMAARYYIEGRTLPGSAKDYGRSAAMVPELSRMINQIPPIIPHLGDEGAN